MDETTGVLLEQTGLYSRYLLRAASAIWSTLTLVAARAAILAHGAAGLCLAAGAIRSALALVSAFAFVFAHWARHSVFEPALKK